MALKQLTDRVNKKLTLQEGDRGCFVETLCNKAPRVYALNVETRLESGELLTGAFKIAGRLTARDQTKIVTELLEQIDEQNRVKPLPVEG